MFGFPSFIYRPARRGWSAFAVADDRIQESSPWVSSDHSCRGDLAALSDAETIVTPVKNGRSADQTPPACSSPRGAT